MSKPKATLDRIADLEDALADIEMRLKALEKPKDKPKPASKKKSSTKSKGK